MFPSRYRIKTNSIVHLLFVFSAFLMSSSCTGPKSGDKCIPNKIAWFPVSYSDMRVTCPQVVEKAQPQAHPETKH
jgi:hypothetical protein